VRDRLDRADADEGRDIEVDLAHLFAAAFEISANEGADPAVEGFNVAELARSAGSALRAPDAVSG